MRTEIGWVGWFFVVGCSGPSSSALFAPSSEKANEATPTTSTSANTPAVTEDPRMPEQDGGTDAHVEAGPKAIKPQDLPDLALWLAADQGTQCDNGRLRSWADLSGNNRHATPPSGFLGPACGAAQLQRKPVLTLPQRTSGNLDDATLLVDLSFLSERSYSVFVVVRKDTNDGDLLSTRTNVSNTCSKNRYFAMGFEQNAFGSAAPQAFFHQCDADATRTVHAPVPQQGVAFALGAWLDVDTGRKVYVNGVESDFNATGEAKAPLLSVNSGRIGRGTGSDAYAGDLAEIVAYSRPLSPTEVTQLHWYFQAKWGL